MGTWSRDGGWIYFRSDRSGTRQIWKIPAEGGEAVQVTKDGGEYAEESWDGRHLYYVKMGVTPGIWRVPVSGGEETLVRPVPDLAFRRGLSVSRSGLYYMRGLWSVTQGVAEYSIHFLDFESGQATKLQEEEGSYTWPDVSVSPDEKWVLYAKQPIPVSELMLVENFR